MWTTPGTELANVEGGKGFYQAVAGLDRFDNVSVRAIYSMRGDHTSRHSAHARSMDVHNTCTSIILFASVFG
jgi:hypothetical protein